VLPNCCLKGAKKNQVTKRVKVWKLSRIGRKGGRGLKSEPLGLRRRGVNWAKQVLVD